MSISPAPVAPFANGDLAEEAGRDEGAAGIGDNTTPDGELEAVLADAWAGQLGVDHVGVDADFFDLGGDSLQAARVLARVREHHGVSIGLETFFAQPTVAALARIIADDDAPPAGVPSNAPIRPVPREGMPCLLPASYGQEGLWFLDQLDPGQPVYHHVLAWRIAGPLDATSLRRALQSVVDRHEALRTTLVAVDGRPRQSIIAHLDVALPVDDVPGATEAERATAERELAQTEGCAPFDLARGPLFRARLLRTDPATHTLVITIYHAVVDGWSGPVLGRDLGLAYRAARAGLDAALPPLSIQYADCVVWERAQLGGERLSHLVARWRATQGGPAAPLALPNDFPRPARPAHRGASIPIALAEPVVAALRALARDAGATMYMTLLAGFALLLHRVTAQAALLIGTPVANRQHSETEDLIGFFANTVVVRADLSGRPTFRELLARLRTAALASLAQHELPFERLIAALHPSRDGSGVPLVAVQMKLDTIPTSTLALDELDVVPVTVDLGTAKFDLNLAFTDVPDGLTGVLTYDTGLFAHATAQRLAAALACIYAEVAADATRRLDEVPLVTPDAMSPLIAQGRGAVAPSSPAPSLRALFAAQARRTPDAIAIAHGDASITYAALERRANRLARHLLAHGARTGGTVAIDLPRSLDLVAALLAALKAGCPYVVLDQADPALRLAGVLRDADARLVLTHAQRADVHDGATCAVLHLDREQAAIDRHDDTPLPDAGTEIAYIAYTSGSTGSPKGVPTPQRGIVGYLDYLIGTWVLGPADVVLQLARASFDASTREIFGTLASGGRVVLVDDADAGDPAALLALIRHHRVTALLAIVPSLLRPLVAAAEDRGTPATNLRLVLTTGEPLLVEDVQRARRHLAPAARYVNQYGPTETTMTATYHECGNAPGEPAALPIGKPIPNVSAHVLDAAMNPVPVGIPGELHLGGAGVTRGYLNDPGLTARKFVADPFDAAFGARLFKTGDLARRRPDGALEFLGRIDRQVKLRGMRAEPAETEQALRAFRDVRDVAVVPWAPVPGDERLAAYIVLRTGAGLDRTALRQHAAMRLPPHLVPAAFVALAALPLTANRKLDRAALPLPAAGDRVVAAVHTPPRDATERTIAAIWTGLLGADVGVHDNFFDLGGHSLLATQVVVRIEERTGVSVSLRQLFDIPTVAALAAFVREHAPAPRA